MSRYRKKPFYVKENKGSVLLMMLFIIAVLMLPGAALLKNAFNERKIAENYLYKIKAHYFAEAGIEIALALLKEGLEPFLALQQKGPFYFQQGVHEGYFSLQWFEPGNPAGDKKYYTLVSTGVYRHTLRNFFSEAQIRALLELRREIAEKPEKDGEENGDEGSIEGKNSNGESSEEEEIIKFVLIRLTGS